MKEVVTTIGDTVAEAVIKGIKASIIKDIEDPLATQTLAQEPIMAQNRLNKSFQPTGSTSQSQVTKSNQEAVASLHLEVKDTQDPSQQNILNIYLAITKEELTETINLLINKVNYLQNKLDRKEHQDPTKRKEKTQSPEKTPKFLPALNIEMDGSQDSQVIIRDEQQPLDYTLVKPARRFRVGERLVLDGSLNERVKKDLKEHLKDKKKADIKTNPKKEMTQQTKDDTIKDMLAKQSLIIGAAPFSTKHIESVMKE